MMALEDEPSDTSSSSSENEEGSQTEQKLMKTDESVIDDNLEEELEPTVLSLFSHFLYTKDAV